MRLVLCFAMLLWSAFAHAIEEDISGLWWNPGEAGWGVSLHHRGDIMFGTLLVYAEDGTAKWYVAPRMGCTPRDGDLDTLCNGPLYTATGPVLGNEPFDASRVALRQVGAIEVATMAGIYGGLTYSIEGKAVTRAIQRLLPNDKGSSVFSGLWINPSEPGWGVSIHHHDDVMFVSLLAYDERGNAHWYVAPQVQRFWGIGDEDVGYSGGLYSASGPVLSSAPFDATRVTLRRVGEINVSIFMGVEGGITYSIDGKETRRAITPFRF